MERTPEQIVASLEKPGAGIPWHHRLFNHALVAPLVARNASWAWSRRRFIETSAAVVEVASGLSEEALKTRVLVPRLLGLEDSSRYWSIAMTARHLNVVGSLMAQVIVRLSHGETIAARVDFAAVKPELERNATESIAEYLAFVQTVPEMLDTKGGNRSSPATMPHPWFGALNAKGWYWLLGTHTRVHLRQAREIRQRLD
jgi:hypothetical protein